jgi:hypothetical protein
VVSIIIARTRRVLAVVALAARELVVAIAVKTGDAWTNWAMTVAAEHKTGTESCS